jgi:hypothetical protein
MASESDKKKLFLAIGLLALAGVAIAWNLGLFSSGDKKAPSAPVEPSKDAAGRPRGGGARTANPGGN